MSQVDKSDAFIKLANRYSESNKIQLNLDGM